MAPLDQQNADAVLLVHREDMYEREPPPADRMY